MPLELNNPPDMKATQTLPIEHLEEYNAACAYYARHGKLPDLMGNPGAIDYINADPEAFAHDVKADCYTLAMANIS